MLNGKNGSWWQVKVIDVNYFCRPVASPENVTEILAPISRTNQD